MADDSESYDEQEHPPVSDAWVSRRRLLQATVFGAAGAAATTDSVPVRADEGHPAHDHSGDRLGQDAPVESFAVNSVSIRDFEEPENYLVYEDGGTWYAYETETQEIHFEDADGVAVINDALEATYTERPLEHPGFVEYKGIVRVVAADGGTVLESSTTIEHEHMGVGLVLEPGVTFEYTGDDAAVRLETGDMHYLTFDVIDANGADYCIRDVEVGSGATHGNVLRGASEALWFVDVPEEEFSGAGQYVNVREFDCTAHPTPYGFHAPSGTDLEFSSSGSEGFWVDIGAIRGPTEKGIVVGSEGVDSNIKFYLFDTYIDGATNDATALVQFNDNENTVILRGFTPATGGDWDVIMGEFAQDSRVHAVTRRRDLRVKRETQQSADLSTFDEFSPEVVKNDLLPESLDAYETVLAGSGEVAVRGSAGRVVHRTGDVPESAAGLRNWVDSSVTDASFDHQAVLQTNVIVPDDGGYEAWLLWGDRGGPAIGWHIVDDLLLGYASDGESETTTALLSEGDVNASDAWNLTAFYNPPTDVVYYIDDLTTVTVSTSTGDETTVIADRPDDTENLPVIVNGRDARWAGAISSNLPSGEAGAHQLMTIEIENILNENRTLQWSNWKNYRYPRGPVGGDAT